MYVDEDALCNIIGLEYIADITQKQIKIIPRDNVITFGKNLLVVQEDVEKALLDSASMLIKEGSDNNDNNSTDKGNNSGTPLFEKKNLSFDLSINQKEKEKLIEETNYTENNESAVDVV